MFRVPSNPEAPTFDETYKVGFFRWLFSKRAERKEWRRRRDAAARMARGGQLDKLQTAHQKRQRRIDAWEQERQEKRREKRNQR